MYRKGITRMTMRRFKVDEKSQPNMPGMMLVTVGALKALGRSATIQEIDQKVIQLEGVTEEEQTFTMSDNKDRFRVNYYLAWARTYLKKGAAVENSQRGVWLLTELGNEISRLDQTKAIYTECNKAFSEQGRANKQAAATSVEKPTIEQSTDSEVAEDDDWKSQLLSVMGDMPADGFERLSQRLLRESGFTQVEVNGKSGDGGIDGVGVLRVNLVSFRISFQCKRWKGSVGAPAIRDFRGALQGKADKGLFITTSIFTPDAWREATRDGAIAIDLIDGDRLCNLLKENQLGVKTEMVERVTVENDWFDSV